jgi:16S rRNA (cytosine967-C5)-methyltransferase
MPLKTNVVQDARSIALDVLLQVEEKDAFSNLGLKAALRHSNLSRKDAALTTEIVYGTLSRMNTLDWMIGQIAKKPGAKLEPWVRNLLRLSLYQLRFLDRIPDHAVVHAAVDEAKRRGHAGSSGFVNGVLRGYLRNQASIVIPREWPKFKRIAIEYSHPEWLVKRWLSIYGEETTVAICAMNNLPPAMHLRINLLKGSLGHVSAALAEEIAGVCTQPSRLLPQGLQVKGGGNLAEARAFHQGLFTIQDESSMLVGLALDVKSGMRVLDTCAAPGGKTTHLAELMGNQGEILALDIHPHKLGLIEETAERLGITIIKTRAADARSLPVELSQEKFDRVLVDAPCSGFGVIRRKPDLKWRKRSQDIPMIAEMQGHILQEAAKWVKPGGKLVYSTCTIDPQENQRVVKQFVENNPQFMWDPTLVEELPGDVQRHFHPSGAYVQLLPQHFGGDGFFISRIVHMANKEL